MLAQRDERRPLLNERESMSGDHTKAAVLERVVVSREVAFSRGRPRPACDVVMVVVGRIRARRGRRQARFLERRAGVCARPVLERPPGREDQARDGRTDCQSDNRNESEPSPGAEVATSRTHRLTVIQAWRPRRRTAAGASMSSESDS